MFQLLASNACCSMAFGSSFLDSKSSNCQAFPSCSSFVWCSNHFSPDGFILIIGILEKWPCVLSMSPAQPWTIDFFIVSYHIFGHCCYQSNQASSFWIQKCCLLCDILQQWDHCDGSCHLCCPLLDFQMWCLLEIHCGNPDALPLVIRFNSLYLAKLQLTPWYSNIG